MSGFNKEDLIALQKLSRMQLASDKEAKFTENIQKILEYMEMLNEVDTKETLPLTHIIKDMKAPLAEDEISDHFATEKFLKSCPEKVGSFLKVPVVIEDKEEM